MKGKRDRKKIADLKLRPMRQSNGDQEELKALARSWLERPAHDIIICPSLKVVDGHRRIEGLVLLGETEADVFVTEEELTETQIRQVGLTTAIHRADLTGYEKWQAINGLLELNPGAQNKELAELLHLDTSQITRLRSPERCIPEAVEALKDGRITISDVYAISKLPPEDQPGLLALKLGGASRDELERKGRQKRNGDTDTEKLEKLPVALHAGVVVIKAKKGEEPINLSAARVLLVEALAKVDSAIKLGYSAKTAVHAWDETKHHVRKARKPRAAKESA